MAEETFRTLARRMVMQTMGYEPDSDLLQAGEPTLESLFQNDEVMGQMLDWLDRCLGERARERGNGW